MMQKPDRGDLPRRRRLGEERRQEKAERDGDEKPDTAARHGVAVQLVLKPSV
jgi:hypothetical protein